MGGRRRADPDVMGVSGKIESALGQIEHRAFVGKPIDHYLPVHLLHWTHANLERFP